VGTLWHSFAEVHEAIELPFGMVSVVGPAIGVLDGVDMLHGEGWFWEFFSSIGLNGFS